MLVPALAAVFWSTVVAAGPAESARSHDAGACLVALTSSCGSAATQQTAIVSGRVVDGTGAPVAAVAVGLMTVDGRPAQRATSGPDGAFEFSAVIHGTYVIRIDAAPGFAPFSTQPFAVGDTGSRVTLDPIVLSVDGFSTSVVVRTPEAVAEEQIAAQEQQRWFGVLPNFYVSYVPDAAPMTSRQKLRLATHETFDWTAYVGASTRAALSQSTGANSGFGDGASGYAKRWAASFADDRIGDMFSHYVFASMFRQDPRYFYQGTGRVKSRLLHALGSPFVARSDRGARMPNYARIVGGISAAALSNLYYPHSERGASLIVSNVAVGLASRAGIAVAQEFLGKHLSGAPIH
jgi:hypothetical protein